MGPVTHPAAGPGEAGPVLGPALGPLLDGLRAGASGYRAWCVGQAVPGADPASSWSEVDESGVAALGSVRPGWLRTVAGELERVRLDTEDVALTLAAVAGVGGPGASTCERVGLDCRSLAVEAGALAAGLGNAGDRAGEVLDRVVRRMLGAAEDSQTPVGGDPRATGERRFERYAELLRILRVEVAAALEQLPEILGVGGSDAGAAGGAVTGDPPRWVAGDPPRWVAGEPPRWVADDVPRRVVGVEPAQRGTAAADGWTPVRGTGALLPGTTVGRSERTDGVRIAQLPDGAQVPAAGQHPAG